MRKTTLILVSAVCVVVFTAVGFAVGWLAHPDQEPEAAPLVHRLAAIIEGSHDGLAQHDDAVAAGALFAADATAVDGPSGETVEGRAAIQGGWQYVFAQGGSWKVEHVLVQDRWGLVVATWAGTGSDEPGTSPRFAMLLEIAGGQIVSEYDLYDAASFPF